VRIHTLWHRGDDDDAPWIVDAVDEYTVDNNCDFPATYAAKRATIEHRELIINVPEKAVRALFDAPEVKATVCDKAHDRQARLAAFELSAEQRASVAEVCRDLLNRARQHEADYDVTDEGDPGSLIAAELRSKEAAICRLLAATDEGHED
jgi:hypothetical protein